MKRADQNESASMAVESNVWWTAGVTSVKMLVGDLMTLWIAENESFILN